MSRDNRALRQRRAGQRGFTLIELLVVIAVLSILAAVVLFNVAGVKNKGNNAACNTDVHSVQAAVDSYSSDNSPANALTPVANLAGSGDATILAPTYLHSIPNPQNSCQTISISFINGADSTAGFKVHGVAPDGTQYDG